MKKRNQIHVSSPTHNRLKLDSREQRLGFGNRTNPLTVPGSEKEILVPVTNSPASENAVDVTMDMAKMMSCGVLLVHVAERVYGGGFLEPEERELVRLQSVETSTEQLMRFADAKRNANVPIRWVVKTGYPSWEILRLAEKENAKWIVMGRTPRNVISRMLFGSVSSDIVDCSPCPVLIINSPARRTSTCAAPSQERTPWNKLQGVVQYGSI
jgi:nucleotide-binding universal stress UspA family protein